jgi:Domain of unknown function (DUF4432)
VVVVDLWGRTWSRASLLERVGSLGQVAGVTISTLADGPAAGVRTATFRNAGLLSFDVLLDRASDIGRVEALGRPVAFWSNVGLVGPWYREPHGDGLLRLFTGGLFVTAGLDHTFAAEEEAGREYPTHGRVNAEPAFLRGYGTEWHGDECELFVETEVRQASMFGETLSLRRRISSPLGSTAIAVGDTVTNEGFAPCSHMMLYHCNFGFPTLDEDATLELAPHLVPVDGKPVPATLPAPAAGVEQELAQMSVPAGTPSATATLRSRTGTMRLSWSSETLPYLMLWQMFAQGSYALGIEPSTNRADGRDDARNRGELKILTPGESVSHEVRFDFDPAESSMRFA